MSNLEKALRKAIVAKNKKVDGTIGGESNIDIASNNNYIDGDINLMAEIDVKGKKELEQLKIISPEIHNTKVVDQFRDIRTHIYQAIKKNNSPILVTSVTGDAGNTFVTRNIAAAIALDDTKTSVIVDCNLLNSGFKDLIGEHEPLGIADYIGADICLEDIIIPVGIPRMRLVYAGTKKESVTDYFTSARLRDLFVELKERYSDRIILADSPAINDFADAKILSNLFDHVVLVVPYRKVSANQISDAVKAIGKDKIIGIVINREPRFLSIFK